MEPRRSPYGMIHVRLLSEFFSELILLNSIIYTRFLNLTVFTERIGLSPAEWKNQNMD